MRPDYDSYFAYLGKLPQERVTQLEGKAFATIRNNGEWDIIAVGEDRRELHRRLEAMNVDRELVVFDRLPPPQFTWNGDQNS